MPPIEAAAATDHRRMSPRRDSGSPSTREIAQTGSGSAKAARKSSSAPSGSAMASSTAVWRTSGSIQVSDRGVKARWTSFRSRVWSGGSFVPRAGVYGHPCARIRATSSATSGGGWVCLCTREENRAESRSTSRAVSALVTRYQPCRGR